MFDAAAGTLAAIAALKAPAERYRGETSVPASGVFATTRTHNGSMIRILDSLEFARVGTPYRRRNKELVLYLRS